MSTKFFLKKTDDTYYSLNSPTCGTKNSSKATKFKTAKEAQYWLDNHSIDFVSVKDCGFEIVEE